jgi:hypothetical protein
MDLKKIELISGKNLRKISLAKRKAFETFYEKNKDRLSGMVSVEWVGLKVQKTPGMTEDVAVIAHADLEISNFLLIKKKFDRNFENLGDLFHKFVLEGFVFCDDETGEYFKCRADRTIENCAHDSACVAWRKEQKFNQENLYTYVNFLE